MTGPINFTNQSSLIEVSGDTGSVLRRYIKVRGNNSFEILGYPGQDNNGSKICFKLEQKKTSLLSLPLTTLKTLPNGHAVNLRYANNTYLKLSGGTLTGNITLNNKSVFWKDADGNEVAKITNAGFIKTTDMFRADRTADANTFESRVMVLLTPTSNLLVLPRSKDHNLMVRWTLPLVATVCVF